MHLAGNERVFAKTWIECCILYDKYVMACQKVGFAKGYTSISRARSQANLRFEKLSILANKRNKRNRCFEEVASQSRNVIKLLFC